MAPFRSGAPTNVARVQILASTQICGLSLLLVPSFAPRGFSRGTPVFSSSQKPTLPNSSLIRNQVEEEPVCGCVSSTLLFINLMYIFIYGNSDVIATLVITNFHLYLIKRGLIQLWWQCFQISVFDDVVYAQTWKVLTPKNPIEPH